MKTSLLQNGIEKTVETLFPLLALLALMVLAALLVRLFSTRRTVLVLKAQDGGVSTDVYPALAERLAQLVGQLSRIESVPPIWLTWLATITELRVAQVLPSGVTDAGQLTLKLGPAEVGLTQRSVQRLLRRIETRELYICRRGDQWALTLQPGRGNLLCHTFSASPESIDQAATLVLAALVVDGKGATEPDLRFLQGVFTMCRFFDPPYKAKYLQDAVALFDMAAQSPVLRTRAKLLAAEAARLAQATPGEAVRRTKEVVEDRSWSRRDKYILNYQMGLAEFYRYDAEGYANAERILKSIPEPRLADGILAWFHQETALRRQLLYLLAQADLAVVNAHAARSREDRDVARGEVLAIVDRVEPKLTGWLQKALGARLEAVRWRCLNARIMTELNTKGDLNAGMKYADEAMLVAPYALAVKANLGRLLMLKAKTAEADNDGANRSRYLSDAKSLFDELLKTGWDPGYVNYRLAQLACAQSNFGLAQTYLDAASNPTARDVDPKLLQKVQDQIGSHSATVL